MDLATDVFIPEDYAKCRCSRKRRPKQQPGNSANLADAHNTNSSFSQENEKPPNVSGVISKEEIVLYCFTP
ncbi:hypothetical protein SUGI_0069930 [Cryptomeria japonica]|nr:hypothetical protein SUGI_0069930 [Cryptomeria japonica]